MKHTLKRLHLLTALALAATLAIGCADEESDLGVGLVDPSTLYSGCLDTIYPTAAYSIIDDSLMTTGYSFGIIGNHSDATYGTVGSVLYTQIALPPASSNIDFSQVTIDSVILCLTSDGLYPDSTATYSFHFEVKQLAEPVLSDTLYYSNQSLPVDEGATFFDATVSVAPTDTVVRLRMDDAIRTVLAQQASAEEFTTLTRGLRIRIVPDGDMGMMGINFAAVRTGLTTYYRYGADTIESEYTFVIGDGATHFTQFSHDYSGTAFASADSVGGAQRLYLEPLAGHRVVLSFDQAVRDFAAAHPRAAIHHAELRLQPDATADDNRPGRIIGLHKVDGEDSYINDFLTTSGDGTYNTADGCYRLRVTQHLQGLLRDGADPQGTHLVLDARRSAAQRTVICGTQVAGKAPHIIIVYSE